LQEKVKTTEAVQNRYLRTRVSNKAFFGSTAEGRAWAAYGIAGNLNCLFNNDTQAGYVKK
jgi:hypothetical protein